MVVGAYGKNLITSVLWLFLVSFFFFFFFLIIEIVTSVLIMPSSVPFFAVSGYPLSAACCIGRICNALEEKWKIL